MKWWNCGRCHKGNLLLIENGTAKCIKCDVQKDLLSLDLLCNKCKEEKIIPFLSEINIDYYAIK